MTFYSVRAQPLQKLKGLELMNLWFFSSFLLTVRRGYRDVPYHNWIHAWTVAHFSYILLKTTNAREYIRYFMYYAYSVNNANTES